MVLLHGHWAATFPRPWHLWQTISLLRLEEVATEATVGAAALTTGRYWFAGDDAVETAIFKVAMDGEGLAAVPWDRPPPKEVPDCCLRHGATMEWLAEDLPRASC